MDASIDNSSNKNFLSYIKSKYILKQIFENIQEKKFLNIMKYNKKLQKKLEMGINDYIYYYNNLIEIEIIPVPKIYGKFINIFNKEEEPFFHFYFNDDLIETKGNNLDYINRTVSKIKIIINKKIKSVKGLFEMCECIEKINFIKFNRKDFIDMSYMFNGCTSLKELNFIKFNTNNIINMSFMFCGCTSLKELDLSNFITNNVIDMSGMFYHCSSLEKINLANFNTINVVDMSWMFNDCSSLKQLDLFNFNTNKVNDMSKMFNNCTSLKKLNIYNFKAENSTKTNCMLNKCSYDLEIICKDNFMKLLNRNYK